MKHICVFCGSSSGARPEYLRAASALGEALARRKIGLVYGGARMGTMEALASAVLGGGGEVIGVMPRDLVEREIAYLELPVLRIVGSMHERKALMAELADAFIALPGGLGTIDELSEVLSQVQLGRHAKPVGLLNVCRYYDSLLAFLDHAVRQRFIAAEHLSVLRVEEDPDTLLDRLAAVSPHA
jgi:uncharacterized protein (TIGR00730 family)